MMVQDEHGLAKSRRNLLIPLHVARGKADVREDDFVADEGRRIGPRPRVGRTDRKVEGVGRGTLGQEMGSTESVAAVPVEDHSTKCQRRHFER